MKIDEYRKIEVVPHNPEWKKIFQREADALIFIFGKDLVRIDHIGSTAILNIRAKPIIDILIECRNIEVIDNYNSKMLDIDYQPYGEYGLLGRRFFVRIKNNVRYVNLHIWQTGHGDLKRHVAFRDYMNRHTDIAKEYSDLKESLAKKFPTDIHAYMEGKNAFIKKHEILALKEIELKI